MQYPKIIRNRYRVGETDNRQHSSYHHEEDMRDFHLPLARLHQRHLHTWGICAGLEVSGAPGATALSVQPGVALDADGRLIVLADNGLTPVVLPLADAAAGHSYVTLRYAEDEQPEPGDTTGRTRPINVQQAPLLRLEAAPGFVEDGLALILAVVEVDAAHQVVALREILGDRVKRRLVGQAVAALDIQRPVTVADRVTTAPAGNLSALPQGGLQLTVANPLDEIIVSGADGNPFAALHIRANTTQMQGMLTLQGPLQASGDLQVAGATQLQGALTVQSALHVSGNLQVVGTTQMQGALTVQSALQVSGDLQVAGTTVLQGVLAVDTLVAGDLAMNAHPPAAKLTITSGGSGNWLFLRQQRAEEGNGGFHVHNPWRDTDGTERNRLEIAYRTAAGEDLWEQVVLHGPTGNVGIGKAAPAHKLDVNGSLNASEFYVNGAPLTALIPAPSPWTLQASNITYTGGDVGIRTVAPDAPLHLHQPDLQTDSGLRITREGRTTAIMLHVAKRDYGYLYLGGDTHLRGNGRTSTFEGSVGIGTVNPQGKLDVQGDIHAGNSDLYFTKADHTHTGTGNTAGWAAIENAANYDALMILGRAGTARGRYVRLWDYLQVNGGMDITGRLGVGTSSPDVKLHVVGNRIRVSNPGNSNQYIDIRADGSALDVESSADLYLNNNGRQIYYRKLSPVSSRELKEEIRELPTQEASRLLAELTPVQFRYKNDASKEQLLGFIAEDVPAILATPDRKGIVPMNLMAVLCGALREQQAQLVGLQSELLRLQALLA